MSKHVLVPVADGTEDIELSCISDILHRGGIKVTLASVMPKDTLQLAHGMSINCPTRIDKVSAKDFDAVLLPGGLPGAEHLGASEDLKKFMHEMRMQNKLYGAMCASPVVALLPLGMLEGVKTATCYPSMETRFPSTIKFSTDCVVKCGNCLTSRGPGTAMFFALAAVALLRSKDVAKEVAKGLLVDHLPELQTVLAL